MNYEVTKAYKTDRESGFVYNDKPVYNELEILTTLVLNIPSIAVSFISLQLAWKGKTIKDMGDVKINRSIKSDFMRFRKYMNMKFIFPPSDFTNWFL